MQSPSLMHYALSLSTITSTGEGLKPKALGIIMLLLVVSRPTSLGIVSAVDKPV